MRLSPLLAIALLVALPAAAYNQHEDSVEAAEDPTGDVTTLGTDEVSRSDTLDLTGLLLGGNATHFHATIQVVDLDGARTQGRDFNDYLFHYHYEGKSYRLTTTRSDPATTPEADVRYTGFIEVFNEATRAYEEIPHEPVFLPRESEDAIDIGIPFASIQGVGGLPASPGFSITGIYVRSLAAGDDRDPLADGIQINTSYDRMPDQGTVSWDIEHRSFDGEDILVHVARPQRLSNGGDNVFAYSIQVSNAADEPATFEFSLTGAPGSWDAGFTDAYLEVPPHGTTNNTAVVRSHTAHAHGDQVRMQIEAKHLETGDSWTNDLSVVFTDPPQPAGHHSTLYFHAARDPNVLPGLQEAYGERPTAPYMNTLSEDETDVGEPVNAELDDFRFWRYPLSPGLGIGLDFILDEPAKSYFTIEPRDGIPVGDVTMWADLRVQSDDRGDVFLARAEAVSIGDVTGPEDVELHLIPTPESDFLPYEPGSNLFLDIWFTTNEAFPGSNPESLVILPGGQLELPLLEFQDPVPLVAGAGVLLEAPSQAPGRSGLDIAVPLKVTNRLAEGTDVRFEARGADPAWNVRFDPPTDSLRAGEESTINVGIQIPDDASDGEVLRFFVAARAEGMPTAVEPVTILIDEDSQPTPFQEDGTKDTPPAAWPALGIALLGLAAWRRLEG